jgi:hypothetical protein
MTVGPPVQIILVPFEIGSPEPLRKAKPPPYPRNGQRQHWPPQQAIPPYVPPADQIEALKRQGRALLDQVRAQRAAHR